METPNHYYEISRLNAGPFFLYETPCDVDCQGPVYYADYLSVPDHPEFNDHFFNILTEIRDNAGYEWYPSDDVTGSIQRGTAQIKRALDGLELATLFTHERSITGISPTDLNDIFDGVSRGITSYQPEYVTMDYAAQYVRAINTSNISDSEFNTQSGRLDTTITGSTDTPTRFYLFTEQNNTIQSTFVNVPVFSGSTIVSANLQSPTPLSVTDLTILKSSNHAVLHWSHTQPEFNQYQVWRSTQPYFTPGDALAVQIGTITSPFTTTVTYIDNDAVGDVNNNYSYVVKAVNTYGLVSLISNRVGAFNYQLKETGGTNYNWVALSLN